MRECLCLGNEYVFMLCWDIEAWITTHICLTVIKNALVRLGLNVYPLLFLKPRKVKLDGCMWIVVCNLCG